MAEQGFGGYLKRQRRRQAAVCEVVRHIAKQPRPALGGAADHHAVGAGFGQYARGFLRAVDIAVYPHGNTQAAFGFGNQAVFGLAAIHLGAGAAVDGDGGNAGVFCHAGNGEDVFVLVVPAQPCFERNRHIHCAHHGM